MGSVSHSHLAQELGCSINVWWIREWAPCCELLYQIGFQLPASILNKGDPGQVRCGRRKGRCSQHREPAPAGPGKMPSREAREKAQHHYHVRRMTVSRTEATGERQGSIQNKSELILWLKGDSAAVLPSSSPLPPLFLPFTTSHSTSHSWAVMQVRLESRAFPMGNTAFRMHRLWILKSAIYFTLSCTFLKIITHYLKCISIPDVSCRNRKICILLKTYSNSFINI